MQRSQSPSASTFPSSLMPAVRLLQWARTGLGGAIGLPADTYRASLELGAAIGLVGAITAVAAVGVPPLLTLGGGLGLAVLFVVARSWVVVRERRHD